LAAVIVMENIFKKSLSRRSFLTLAACSMLGMLPTAHAEKNFLTLEDSELSQNFSGLDDSTTRAEKNFVTLEEMNIGGASLEFDEMTLRTYTGAIIVHHFGLLRGDTDASLEEIHEMHKNKNHWSGIGYHFVIHKDGTIERARPLEYIGAHAKDNNEFTVGVALAGNYQFGTPPQIQLEQSVKLIGALCHKYKFPATDTTILGHRDVCKTTCPGRNLYKLLPQLIDDTKNYLKEAT